MADALFAALASRIAAKQQNNPWARTGEAIAGGQFVTPEMSGKDALIVGLAQGLSSGLFKGMGERQQRRDSQEISQRLVDLLRSSDKSAALAKDPDFGDLAPLLQIQEFEQKRELEQKRAEKAQDFQLQQLGQGRVFDPTTGSFGSAPGFAETEAAAEGAKAKAKYALDMEYAPQLEGAKTSAQKQAALKFLGQEEAIKAGAQARAELMKENIKLRSPGKVSEREDALRKELNTRPEVQQFSTIDTAFQSMLQSYPDESGASDLDFIFGVMKILDPDSVVREGEQERAIKTAGIPGQVWSAFQSIQGGARLAPEVKMNLLNVAGRRYDAVKEKADKMIGEYVRMAETGGGSGQNVNLYPQREGSAAYLQRLQPPATKGYTVQELRAQGYTPKDIEALRLKGMVR